MLIQDNPRVSMNRISIRSETIKALKVLSNVAASTVQPARAREEYNWPSTGIVTIKNITEEPGLLNVKVLKSPASIMIRSSRQRARIFQDGDNHTIPLQPGEALTLVSLDHNAPLKGNEASASI